MNNTVFRTYANQDKQPAYRFSEIWQPMQVKEIEKEKKIIRKEFIENSRFFTKSAAICLIGIGIGMGFAYWKDRLISLDVLYIQLTFLAVLLLVMFGGVLASFIFKRKVYQDCQSFEIKSLKVMRKDAKINEFCEKIEQQNRMPILLEYNNLKLQFEENKKGKLGAA